MANAETRLGGLESRMRDIEVAEPGKRIELLERKVASHYREFQDLQDRVAKLEGQMAGRTEAPQAAWGGYYPGQKRRRGNHLALPTPPLPHG